MSKTKPHASVPPPPTKSNGECFWRVFHVVIQNPEFTRRCDPPFWAANFRGEGGVICCLI